MPMRIDAVVAEARATVATWPAWMRRELEKVGRSLPADPLPAYTESRAERTLRVLKSQGAPRAR